MTTPTFDDFLKAQAEEEIDAASLDFSSGYALRPLNRKYPSVKQLYPNTPRGEDGIVSVGHRPPNGWAVGVRLGRDPRRFTFTCPSKRDADNLARQFLFKLRDYIDDESADFLWNKLVLQAARNVDARLKQIGGIDPPRAPVKGPVDATGHEHEWLWTGTWSEARPFPVWHMRCQCGGWALLGNQVGTVSGEWLDFDTAVHDVRQPDGKPAEAVN